MTEAEREACEAIIAKLNKSRAGSMDYGPARAANDLRAMLSTASLQAPLSDRLDEAAQAIDHIRTLGPPIESPYEGRDVDWRMCCDRCRAQVLALRLQASPERRIKEPKCIYQPLSRP